MQDHSIEQLDRIPLVQRVLTLLSRGWIRKVFLAKWIRREQAVSAHVPARQRVKTFWMAHDRDSDRFRFDWSGIIDPPGRQTPCGCILLALAIHDMAAIFGIH